MLKKMFSAMEINRKIILKITFLVKYCHKKDVCEINRTSVGRVSCDQGGGHRAFVE